MISSRLFLVRAVASENAYLKAKYDVINRAFGGKHLPNLAMLWDGDGKNDNAALTIFRHFDSATVVRGLVGEAPQTAWIVGYPLLERIHYLLVAGYDVYGTVGHQVTTRMYMDFLRMEGEANFLTLLPMDARDGVRDHWYRGVGNDVKEYLDGSRTFFARDTGVKYRTLEPLPELYGLLRKQFSRVLSHRYELTTGGLAWRGVIGGILSGLGGSRFSPSWPPQDALSFKLDVFEFGRDEVPRMRLLAQWEFLSHFFISAAIDHPLRDHRTGEVKAVDRDLLGLLVDLRRELGTEEPFHVISGYRSPRTNAMLVARSGGGVARHSLHLEARAIDVRLPGVRLGTLREAALDLRRGGVGFYPDLGFVHVDTGRVRRW